MPSTASAHDSPMIRGLKPDERADKKAPGLLPGLFLFERALEQARDDRRHRYAGSIRDLVERIADPRGDPRSHLNEALPARRPSARCALRAGGGHAAAGVGLRVAAPGNRGLKP